MFDEIKKHKKGSYVFHSQRTEKLSYSTVYKIFKNIDNYKISPHTLRHSFATRIIEKGVPLNYVSELLGHSNINTTLAYIHSNKEYLFEILQEKE